MEQIKFYTNTIPYKNEINIKKNFIHTLEDFDKVFDLEYKNIFDNIGEVEKNTDDNNEINILVLDNNNNKLDLDNKNLNFSNHPESFSVVKNYLNTNEFAKIIIKYENILSKIKILNL
jgi:hypothetical protein